MPERSERLHLRRLLGTLDELDALGAHQPGAAELVEKRRASRQQAADFLAAAANSGPLVVLVRRYGLNEEHVLLLLQLLRQRLRQDDPYVGGRRLLAGLFDSSFALLDGLQLLAPSSPLLNAGVVLPNLQEAPTGAEILDLRYRISDRAFQLLTRALGEPRGESAESLDRPVSAYVSSLQYLVELRRLALLYQKRAAKVFHYDEWDELGFGLPDSLVFLNRLIPRYSKHLRSCLDATPDSARYPLVHLQRQCGLGEDECVILITLVFRELLQGNPYLDAADLLKLVCHSEADVIVKRKLLAEDSPLVSNRLVMLEEVILGKDLSAEVYVPNEVVDRILGPARQSSGRLDIDAASRKDFQQFLRDLDNSEDFFDNL